MGWRTTNTGYYTYLEGLSFEGLLNFQWMQVELGACCFEHLKPERFRKNKHVSRCQINIIFARSFTASAWCKCNVSYHKNGYFFFTVNVELELSVL